MYEENSDYTSYLSIAYFTVPSVQTQPPYCAGIHIVPIEKYMAHNLSLKHIYLAFGEQHVFVMQYLFGEQSSFVEHCSLEWVIIL